MLSVGWHGMYPFHVKIKANEIKCLLELEQAVLSLYCKALSYFLSTYLKHQFGKFLHCFSLFPIQIIFFLGK